MTKKKDAVVSALPDDPKIKKEYDRLFRLFEGADEKQLELAKGEIAQAAFLKVMIDKLAEDVSYYGYEEEYQNGENQIGRKESTAAKLHNTFVKNYLSVMKQLHEFLDKLKPQEQVGGEELDEFERY